MFYYILITPDNVNTKLSIAIEVDESQAPDYWFGVNITISHDGWRPVDILTQHYGNFGDESGPFTVILMDSNGNIISDMCNDYNSSHGRIQEVKPGKFAWTFILMRNKETVLINYLPVYNLSATSGPYSLQVIYDTTDVYQKCWKGVLESETIYFDW